MTIKQLLLDNRDRLTLVSGDFALTDAETIIEHALDISRTELYVNSPARVDDDALTRINTMVERRLKSEPLPYILGKAYFYDREFFVDGNVLIPRPDTETLVEAVINSEKRDRAEFIDIGTGSGILAVVLTSLRPEWSAVGVDLSIDALRIAARNCNNGDNRRSRRDKNIRLVCGDLLSAITPAPRFDFIVGNPPYISSRRMAELDRSVTDYEPRIALHGGDDGLDCYKMISARAKNYIKDGGRVYLEIGFDQGESVPGIFNGDGWADIAVIKDLGGRDRVVTAQKKITV